MYAGMQTPTHSENPGASTPGFNGQHRVAPFFGPVTSPVESISGVPYASPQAWPGTNPLFGTLQPQVTPYAGTPFAQSVLTQGIPFNTQVPAQTQFPVSPIGTYPFIPTGLQPIQQTPYGPIASPYLKSQSLGATISPFVPTLTPGLQPTFGGINPLIPVAQNSVPTQTFGGVSLNAATTTPYIPVATPATAGFQSFPITSTPWTNFSSGVQNPWAISPGYQPFSPQTSLGFPGITTPYVDCSSAQNCCPTISATPFGPIPTGWGRSYTQQSLPFCSTGSFPTCTSFGAATGIFGAQQSPFQTPFIENPFVCNPINQRGFSSFQTWCPTPSGALNPGIWGGWNPISPFCSI